MSIQTPPALNLRFKEQTPRLRAGSPQTKVWGGNIARGLARSGVTVPDLQGDCSYSNTTICIFCI